MVTEWNIAHRRVRQDQGIFKIRKQIEKDRSKRKIFKRIVEGNV